MTEYKIQSELTKIDKKLEKLTKEASDLMVSFGHVIEACKILQIKNDAREAMDIENKLYMVKMENRFPSGKQEASIQEIKALYRYTGLSPIKITKLLKEKGIIASESKVTRPSGMRGKPVRMYKILDNPKTTG